MNLTGKLKHRLGKIPPFKKIIIAVSGGADSVVLAHELKKQGYNIVIAHLNHQLRNKEGDKDEQLVKKTAIKWNVVCVTEKADIPKKGNLEQNARKIRYTFLERVRTQYKADYIAVAHHADDQMETILMHTARGAGLRGQIGMTYKSGKIIRPLLDINKQEILDYAKKNNLDYRTDKSNHDLSYERNFWRNLVIPYLKNDIKKYTQKTKLEQAIKDISDKSAKKLKIISQNAKKWTSENVVNEQFERETFSSLNKEVQSEILIQILGAKDLYKKNLDELIRFILKSKSGKQMTIKKKTFLSEHNTIFIQKETSKLVLPKSKITISGIKWGKWLIKSDYGKPLYVRQRNKGDKFQPSGMIGHKKLQDFFVDSKIPRHMRDEIPVIVNSDNAIIAVGNIRISNSFTGVKNHISIKEQL